MLRQLLVTMVDDATFAILDVLNVSIVFAVNDPLDSIPSISLAMVVVANFDLFVWLPLPEASLFHASLLVERHVQFVTGFDQAISGAASLLKDIVLLRLCDEPLRRKAGRDCKLRLLALRIQLRRCDAVVRRPRANLA